MSSSSTPIAKNTNAVSQTLSPSQSQSSSTIGAESYPQRRSGGSGSFGAGSAFRTSPAAARNSQSSRKNHKGQRRPRLADEDAAAESAAMQSTSSRKGQTSITHLMSFALPPRPQHQQQSNYSRYSRRNPSWGIGSGYHAADKAKYVHANYRFIVDPRGDYHAQAMDADVHLDWNLVLQILVSAQSQSSSCPICLSTPIAPRMAKCGHIFCLPCLIRYMHSTDDEKPMPEKKARWKKCPICWDSVYISETRPVRWFSGQEGVPPREGCDVVLRLISRRAGSTLAMPRDGAESLDRAEEIPWYFAAEVMDYARVMKGSEDYMSAQYTEEINVIELQEKEDELIFEEGTLWTRKAVAAIREAQERLIGVGNPPTAPQQPVEKKPKRTPVIFHEEDKVPGYYTHQHSTKSGQSSSGRPLGALPSSSLLTDCSNGTPSLSQTQNPFKDQALIRLRGNSNTTSYRPTDDFYFYEALLHYYLSPLDIRILKTAFGDFSAFPTTVLPRVERVSTGHIVDDELRRRAKYLSHLPQGCEVGFLECDWTDVVVPEVLAGFSVEIERRRKKNREKEAREEKERARAEKEEEDKRWASTKRRRPSNFHETIIDEDFQPIPPLREGHEYSLASETTTSSSPPWPISHTQGASSFATLASPSTSPVAPRTVWGTAAVPKASSPSLPELTEPEPPDNDGWLQDWERNLLHDDELVARFQSSSVSDKDLKVGVLTGGKKKKNKKITLMTTNARRGA